MKELRVTFRFKDGAKGASRRYTSAELAVEDTKELYKRFNSQEADVHLIQVNGMLFAKPPGVRALRKLLGTTA